MTKPKHGSGEPPPRERTSPATDAHETARLSGVRVPRTARTKKEREALERDREAEERERERLLAAGDTQALYRFELERRREAAKKGGHVTETEQALRHAHARFTAQQEAAKIHKGRPRATPQPRPTTD